jgi:predicted nuclease with RNAse H fold
LGLDAHLGVVISEVLDPEAAALDRLLTALPPNTPVAIDGPGGVSAAPYAADLSVAQKFRSARGCEVELGRQRRIWVPFATPTASLDPWMGVAVHVHERSAGSGHVPLEVYPHAVFCTLLGRRPPSKSTPAGITARVDALRSVGLTDRTLPLWSHDSLDAAAAAVVAVQHAAGTAVRIGCELDGTAIWLPSTPTATQAASLGGGARRSSP